MNCLQCRRALDSQTSPNGFSAHCAHCGIEHLSLGVLMKLSDSQLTAGIWEMIHSPALRRDWKTCGKCPRCAKDTVGVPFQHAGRDHALIACSHCHVLAMKSETLQVFREANSEYQRRQLHERNLQSQQKLREDVQRDVENAKRLIRAGVERADYLLNETPLREVRVTVAVAAASVVFSLFTMLLPYAAMNLFGGPASFAVLSAFTHVTFFHLAWNLLFFLPLGMRAEREMGSVPYALTFGVILSVSASLGRLISPFPEAPMIGLAPLVAALLGRAWILQTPFRFGKFSFDFRTVAFVFAIAEFRTMIPTSGGMRWFTLGACIIAASTSAAFTHWQRRREAERASTRKRSVVEIDSRESKALARVSGGGAVRVKNVA